MQHGDGLAEALLKAPDDLRRQRDLGHEHDRAAALLQRVRGGAQVDLGLARSRHPLQQAPLEPATVEHGVQRLERLLLLGGEAWQASLRAPGWTPADGQVLRAHDRAAAAALTPAEPARGAGGQHERQRARDRRAVLRRDPLGQRDQLDGHAQLQRPQRREQLLLGDLAVLGQADDDSEHMPAGERDDQHRADVHDAAAQLVGQAIVKRPVQRTGRRHRLDLGDARYRAKPGWSIHF